MSKPEIPSDAKLIEVNGRIVDPNENYATDAAKTDHIVITLYDNLTTEQHSELDSLEVQFQEDLGDYNYLCRYRPVDLEPIRSFKWIRQVDVYRNIFKIPSALHGLISELQNAPQDSKDGTVSITVLPHHEFNNDTDLQRLAVSITEVTGVDSNNVEVLTGKIQTQVKVGQIEKIAALGAVRVIEEVLVPLLADDRANEIVLGQNQNPTLRELKGSNQVIAVIDSGFDLGTPDNCHPAFEGRIKKLISLNRGDVASITEAQRYDDPEGHGTHVCGTIVGQHIRTHEGVVGGIAPNAQLVVSSSWLHDEKGMGSLGAVKDISKAFLVPYHEHGARIFSNSWGDPLNWGRQRVYSTDAEAIDGFVREHPDALVIFSAGNNNIQPPEPGIRPSGPVNGPTIGSQAAAKNCLTVGACGTTRITEKHELSGLTVLQPDEIYPLSSRGLTKESRIKPDVVAPGFNILSARSRHRKVKCAQFKTTSDDYPAEIFWQIRCGTSHSTPLIAGCAAILRQAAEENGISPSAALLKAIIINGADKLPNVDSQAQGFGRINVTNSGEMIRERPVLTREAKASIRSRNCGTLIGDGITHGGVFETILNLDVQSQRLFKITLVYNDIKGAKIQNNLNLSVINPSTGAVTNGYESEDNIMIQNNVEQITLILESATTLKIRVVGQKVFPGSSQDFVLAWAVTKPYTGFSQV